MDELYLSLTASHYKDVVVTKGKHKGKKGKLGVVDSDEVGSLVVFEDGAQDLLKSDEYVEVP